MPADPLGSLGQLIFVVAYLTIERVLHVAHPQLFVFMHSMPIDRSCKHCESRYGWAVAMMHWMMRLRIDL